MSLLKQLRRQQAKEDDELRGGIAAGWSIRLVPDHQIFHHSDQQLLSNMGFYGDGVRNIHTGSPLPSARMGARNESQ